MRWNRLRRATRIAPWGVTPQAARGDQCNLKPPLALPAHFMHSEGNFQFWDPVSRILFSGDLGVSLGTSAEAGQRITSLAPHLPRMEAFHRRYMVSQKVLRLWVNMARTLPIEMIVPQHGAPLVGDAIPEFLAWIGDLSCGVDHLTQANYAVPA